MYLKVGSDSDALNLSKLINDGNWMVLYYAEWCGHCKTMKPEWKQVVNKLNNPSSNSNKINVAEIESQHIDKLLNKPEIEGFPTIKMYNNGKPVANFNEERIASKIEEFANNNAKNESMKKNILHSIQKELNEKKTSKMEIQLNNLSESIPNNIKTNKINELTNIIESKKNELKMNNLIMPINNKLKNNKIIQEHIKEQNKHIYSNQQDITKIPCTDIIRAKKCKSQSRCMYDGTDLKCKDRLFMPIQSNINYINKIKSNKKTQNNMVGNIIFKSSKHTKPSKRAYTRQNKKTNSRPNKNNNIRKTTKSVFNQLIKSFGHIGNEAKKNSKLLKNASNKLVN